MTTQREHNAVSLIVKKLGCSQEINGEYPFFAVVLSFRNLSIELEYTLLLTGIRVCQVQSILCNALN